MADRYFSLRLDARYGDAKNTIDDLRVEILHDGQWEAQQLDIQSPGFLLFINGLFSCQHLYVRTNCAERDIVLESLRGTLDIVTDDTWHIEKGTVQFTAVVKSGVVTEDAKAYIIERMHHCPVSSNLPPGLRLDVAVDFT